MTIKSDFIALLNTLQPVSGVTCSLWYSALLKNVLISLLGLGLGIVAFFNYLFSPPLLGHLVEFLRFAVFGSLTDTARKEHMITSSSDDSSV